MALRHIGRGGYSPDNASATAFAHIERGRTCYPAREPYSGFTSNHAPACSGVTNSR
jgi:hypothetical protein